MLVKHCARFRFGKRAQHFGILNTERLGGYGPAWVGVTIVT